MLSLPALDPSPLPGRTCYADQLDPGLLYVLPTDIVVGTADGTPDFTLVRYRDTAAHVAGGTLRVGLSWAPIPELAPWTVQSVRLDAAFYRLIDRIPLTDGGSAVGPWVSAQADGGDIATVILALDQHQAQLVEQLLDGSDLLDIEVSFGYSAVVPGQPWLVSADRLALAALLQALLPAGPVTADQIGAAFASLPTTPSPFGYTAQRPDTGPLPDLMAEIAARSLAELFVATPAASGWDVPTYLLQTPTPGRLLLDLLVPRWQRLTGSASWSIAGFAGSLTEQQRLLAFPAVSIPDPYQSSDIAVLCSVPFDPQWLQSVQVDLSYRGPTGTPQQRTLTFPDGGAVQHVHAVIPPGQTDLALRWTAHSRLAPPADSGWPRMVDGAPTGSGSSVLVIDRHTLGLDFVHILIDQAVFDDLPTVCVQIGGDGATAPMATSQLDAAHCSSWPALPGVGPDDALMATITAGTQHSTAAAATAAAQIIWQGEVVDRLIRLSAADVLNAGLAVPSTVSTS